MIEQKPAVVSPEETTEIKLSEALKLGRMMYPKVGRGTYFKPTTDGDYEVCALGAIAVGLGYGPEDATVAPIAVVRRMDGIRAQVPWLTRETTVERYGPFGLRRRTHVNEKLYNDGELVSLHTAIYTANDLGATTEELVAWLEKNNL